MSFTHLRRSVVRSKLLCTATRRLSSTARHHRSAPEAVSPGWRVVHACDRSVAVRAVSGCIAVRRHVSVGLATDVGQRCRGHDDSRQVSHGASACFLHAQLALRTAPRAWDSGPTGLRCGEWRHAQEAVAPSYRCRAAVHALWPHAQLQRALPPAITVDGRRCAFGCAARGLACRRPR